jgi:hypothetical protein
MLQKYALLPILIVSFFGCDKPPEKVKVYPVKGTIMVGGKPAEGVKVFFVPTSAPTMPQVPQNPYGVTKADGTFELTTFGGNDGAGEGGYQVVLIWPETVQEGEESIADRFMGWFDLAHTKFTATVKGPETSLPPFQLNMPKGPPEVMQGIPGRN